MTEEQKTPGVPLTEETSFFDEAIATAPAVETVTDESGDKKKVPAKKSKKKAKQQVAQGRAYIQSTFNNTIITLTDQNGNVLAWSSAGKCGFRGPKKATPYAAGIIVKNVVEKAAPYGLKEVSVFVKGVGYAREAAVRGLNANGINVLSINDITPIPHNGCRPKKARRV